MPDIDRRDTTGTVMGTKLKAGTQIVSGSYFAATTAWHHGGVPTAEVPMSYEDAQYFLWTPAARDPAEQFPLGSGTVIGADNIIGGVITLGGFDLTQNALRDTSYWNPVIEATRELKARWEAGNSSNRYMVSAQEALFHSLDTTTYQDLSAAQLDDIIADAVSRKEQLNETRKNVEKFEARIRAFREGLKDPNISDTVGRADGYWKGLRTNLERWFGLSAKELAQLLGIANGTLFDLDRRAPRTKTVRKIMDVYEVARLLVTRRGEDVANRWLANEGRRILQEGSVTDLDRAVSRMLFGRTKSREAVVLDHVPDDFDSLAPAPLTRRDSGTF